jgi:hypothetical protein
MKSTLDAVVILRVLLHAAQMSELVSNIEIHKEHLNFCCTSLKV